MCGKYHKGIGELVWMVYNEPGRSLGRDDIQGVFKKRKINFFHVGGVWKSRLEAQKGIGST